MLSTINHDPKNTIQARIQAFRTSDLIFFEYEERQGEIVSFDLPIVDGKEVIHRHKVAVLLSTNEFKKHTKQLRTVQDKIFRNLKPGHYGPGPCYEDVKDIEVYKFIHEKIVELKDVLPKKFRESLELD